MKGVIKVFSVLFFSLGLFLTAKAQDDSLSAPAQDEIVCTQIAENVFDCFVVPGGEFDQYEGEPGTQPDEYLEPENREEELNREEMDRENQEQRLDPSEGNENPEEMDTEEEYWTEPETPSNPSDPYYQEMNLPRNI